MIHPTICNMIHSCRPLHLKILHLPTTLPNRHTHPNYRQQPIRSIHRMRRSRNHIIPTNQLMTRPSRSQHCRPTSRTLQPSRRCRTHHLHSMTSLYHKHLRNPTTPYPHPNPHTTTTRPHPSCNRKIRSIWSPPMTPRCNRRTNPRIRPTPLKHNSSRRNLPTHPNPPLI